MPRPDGQIRNGACAQNTLNRKSPAAHLIISYSETLEMIRQRCFSLRLATGKPTHPIDAKCLSVDPLSLLRRQERHYWTDILRHSQSLLRRKASNRFQLLWRFTRAENGCIDGPWCNAVYSDTSGTEVFRKNSCHLLKSTF